MRYYDLVANWSKVEPFLNHPKVQETINANYNRYSLGHTGLPFEGMTIEQFYEHCLKIEYGDDWKEFDVREGDRQPYWTIACPRSCHWSANVNLELAKLAEADRSWRIISGKNHSTVWDGEETIFETHYFVVNLTAQECYDAAKVDSTEGEVGEQVYASAPIPWFVPDWFEAKNYKQFNMKAIAADARCYLNNLIKSFRGKVDEAFPYIAIYELTRQFVQAVQDTRRTRSAKLLQQLRDFEYVEAAESVTDRVEHAIATTIKKINRPGYNIAFGNPQEFLKESVVRSAYAVTESGLKNEINQNDKDPLESLRNDIRHATYFEWGWVLLVQKGKEPHSLWTFDRFRAAEWEPSRILELVPEETEEEEVAA